MAGSTRVEPAAQDAAEAYADALEASYGEPPLTGSDIEAVNVQWSSGRTSGDATVVLESDGGVRERMLPRPRRRPRRGGRDVAALPLSTA